MSSSSNSNIAVIEFGDGKLNPLGGYTRQAIYDQLKAYEQDSAVHAIVLVGRGGTHFCAGADMVEFMNPIDNVVSVGDLCHYIESYPKKPIVAAISGVALGGGLELALACHYRVALGAAKLGLPEVTVGVIPGAGGTQRLPRVVGIQAAVDMVCRGKQVSGDEAFPLKLVDGVCPPQQKLVDCAAQWATWALSVPTLPRARNVLLDAALVQQVCDATNLPPVARGGFGVHAALRAMRASVDFEEGCRVEQDLFWDTLAHPQGQARRHAFFAVRAAQKGLQAVSSHALLTPKTATVGVVGAGLMGSGIGLVLLQAGYTLRLVDINDKALQKGLAFLKYTIGSNVKRGTWTKQKADSILKRLHATTSLEDLKDCSLVVEAVVENLHIKQSIFKTLDRVTPPHALLVSNTSTLSIDAIASALSSSRRRQQCAGWHFFSPAHKMQLVEIVVAQETSPETVALLQHVTKGTIRKIGVTVGNCHGFVGNRMVAPYSGEACFLLAEGIATVQSVDEALQNVHGMAMGPFSMGDLAGNDVGYFIRQEQGLTRDPKTGTIGPNRGTIRYTEMPDDMVTKLGRLGQKAGKGWYDYNPKIGKGRKGIPSPELTEFIKRYHPPTPKQPPLTAQEIIERVLFPLVNEGFKILEEGHAARPSDIDVVYLYGYGWPAWRGGPMFWADHEIGLPVVLRKLQEWYQAYPGSEWFQPSALLETCVAANMTIEEYCKQKTTPQQAKL